MSDYNEARQEILNMLLKVKLPDPLSLYCIFYELANMTAWILEGYHNVSEKELDEVEKIAVHNITQNEFMKGILKQ